MSARVLLPFIGAELTRATLDEALREARSRQATLVPAYLLLVPEHLSLESPAPARDAEAALPLLELIEQVASRAGIAVDARIARGRTYGEALTGLLETERFDAVVPGDGLPKAPRPSAAAI
jgi:nucleotide-binding universal stress UspA family protein